MSSEAPPPAGLLASLVPFLPTYLHLLLAALLPIYTGAHASLRRPLNTLSPKELRFLRPARSPAGVGANDNTDDDEDGEHEFPAPETLSAFDAAMFPVTAAAVLSGLYFLIKYLDDPSLLSRILTWYFCAMGVFAVGKSFADALGVAVGIVFPPRFRDAQGALFRAGFDSWSVQGTPGTAISSPFPSAPLLPQALHPAVWALRRRLRARWLVNVKCMGEVLRKSFWIGDLLGPVAGLVVVATYAVGGKHWLLTNIMGISFSYGAMQLMSPTTFPTATLLLGLLFAYDIFFVFYTPLMVTVATSLDVPIKLLFPRPGKTASGSPALAMLGLGDVVLPGILIAMALRWDLWRFYEVQRRNLVEAAKLAQTADHHHHQPTTKADEKSLKPRYTRATGSWGLLFWDPRAASGDFPKPYFTASIVGYVVGMLTTLAVMHVFQQAQPALLYLVPGVLGSVWGTAFVRGETKAMWHYSEEQQPDEAEKAKKEKEKQEQDKKKREALAAAKRAAKGEVDKPVLTVEIIRRPAVEARREYSLPAAAAADDCGEAIEESSESDDSHGDGDDDSSDHDGGAHEEEEGGSTSSEEVVVEDPKNPMWATTIIDQTG